jgi:hypothetical protein
MFLARRPSLETIDRFLRDSQDLPLSYSPIGIIKADTVFSELIRSTTHRGAAEQAVLK